MGGKNKWLSMGGLWRLQLLPIKVLIVIFWGVGSSPSTNYQHWGVGRGWWVWDGGDVQDTQHWGRKVPWAVLVLVPELQITHSPFFFLVFSPIFPLTSLNALSCSSQAALPIKEQTRQFLTWDNSDQVLLPNIFPQHP